MGQVFDIAQEELPLFLSECDEHLQALDGTLVQIEQYVDDHDALQSAFRSAHTLKGMAGMIGHTRMVRVTHAMETLLDGVRKGELLITTNLVNLCLDAVDSLRALREEVVQGEVGDFDVEALVSRFSMFEMSTSRSSSTRAGEPVRTQAPEIDLDAAPGGSAGLQEAPKSGDSLFHLLEVRAEIDMHSIASAARAFQLMLALQELGTIQEMQPSQALIETAAPVKQFHARLLTDQAIEKVQQSLASISEISHLVVEEIQVESAGRSELAEVTGVGDDQTLLVQPVQPGPRKVDKSGLDQAQAEVRESTVSNNKNNDQADRVVRTSVERLDALMSLVGELITDRNHLLQLRDQLDHQNSSDIHFDQLTETVAHISRITDQLQEEVMQIRMLPIGDVFLKFPRMVRDLAQKTGKKVDLIIRGEDTELDRSVIEKINDPLIHLLRNAVDHGIEGVEERLAAGKPERGRVWLTARHEQGRILITVEDDGRGINCEQLRKKAVESGLLTIEDARNLPDDKTQVLIFASGISTADQISDISGRGVGMDIVRNNIQRLNGNILIDSKPGCGTQFQVIIPLTLAIIPALLVQVGAISLAIPIVMVAETLRLSKDEIRTVQGKPVTLLRNKVLPLIPIHGVFDLHTNGQHRQNSYAVVVYHGKEQVGLMVDELLGKEEVVVKSLGSLIGDIPGVSSATILGDGRVALILDVIGLLKTFEVG
jgi:two-component system, chemotaxis family, sensor kinase CheA